MDWRPPCQRLLIFFVSLGLGAAVSIITVTVLTRSIPLTVHQLTGPLNSAVTATPIAIKGLSGLPSLLSEHTQGRWAIIGGALLQAGFTKASLPALKRAVANDNGNIMLHVALGEALAMANRGWITKRAKAEFDIAIKADPNDLIARFYMAHWLLQNGKAKLALVKWVGLMRTVGDDKVWYDRLWDVMPRAAEEVGVSKLALKALCTASM